MAAHAYQRALFLEHGFSLWNNYWYAGHYSFITYSLLYYPLAAVLGIRPLAVLTVTMGALLFAVVTWREWGSESCSRAHSPSRSVSPSRCLLSRRSRLALSAGSWCSPCSRWPRARSLSRC